MNALKYLTLATLVASVAVHGSVRADDHPQAEAPKSERSATEPASEHPHSDHPSAQETEHPGAETSPTHQHDAADIVALAAGAEHFGTLIGAIQAAGLVETLRGEGPFTVFAPTDEAFAKLPEGSLQDLLKPENREMLVNVLNFHIVAGRVAAADMKSSKMKAANGQELTVKVGEAGITVHQAKVIGAEIVATNGVIHAIDAVLLPAAPESRPETKAPKDHPGH